VKPGSVENIHIYLRLCVLTRQEVHSKWLPPISA